jgi:hypothetical protein
MEFNVWHNNTYIDTYTHTHTHTQNAYTFQSPNRYIKYITAYTEKMTRMPEHLRQKALQHKS